MKEKLQTEALELATLIHEAHKRSYWEQQYLVQELIAELARLDQEFQESEATLGSWDIDNATY